MNWKRLLALAAGMVLAAGATHQAYAAMVLAKVTLKPTPLAQNAGLQGASGQAELDVQKGDVEIIVTLPAGARVPEGSVLEGWLVSAGTKGGPGMAHASDADQKYGPAFGSPEFAKLSRELPYALSTGKLKQTDARSLVNKFHIDNTLIPCGAVVVTIESDGNQGAYDPRPGTPILVGEIAAP
jgi:hypothetical protein